VHDGGLEKLTPLSAVLSNKTQYKIRPTRLDLVLEI